MENKQTQERVRQLVYTNLDRLFEELNELNQKTTKTEDSIKRKREK